MYLHIGNNVMLPEKHIIGVFDLEITSQSKRTSEFLRRAEDESLVIDACEDIPKSFWCATTRITRNWFIYPSFRAKRCKREWRSRHEASYCIDDAGKSLFPSTR